MVLSRLALPLVLVQTPQPEPVRLLDYLLVQVSSRLPDSIQVRLLVQMKFPASLVLVTVSQLLAARTGTAPAG